MQRPQVMYIMHYPARRYKYIDTWDVEVAGQVPLTANLQAVRVMEVAVVAVVTV